MSVNVTPAFVDRRNARPLFLPPAVV